MSTKTIGVVGRGSGRHNSMPTIPTIPTAPTIPTIPTPWGRYKLKPMFSQAHPLAMIPKGFTGGELGLFVLYWFKKNVSLSRREIT